MCVCAYVRMYVCVYKYMLNTNLGVLQLGSPRLFERVLLFLERFELPHEVLLLESKVIHLGLELRVLLPQLLR